jgi:hypothetical protein
LEKYDLAEAVCSRLRKLKRKILGDQHKDILETVGALRECFEKQGKHEAIEYLDRSVFKSLRKSYSIAHNDTLCAASKLVDTLVENGKDLEAEKFLRRMLNIDQSIVAADNHRRTHFAFDFGILLYRQEKWSEAENTFRDMLNTLRENRGEEQESKDDMANTSESNHREGEHEGETKIVMVEDIYKERILDLFLSTHDITIIIEVVVIQKPSS